MKDEFDKTFESFLRGFLRSKEETWSMALPGGRVVKLDRVEQWFADTGDEKENARLQRQLDREDIVSMVLIGPGEVHVGDWTFHDRLMPIRQAQSMVKYLRSVMSSLDESVRIMDSWGLQKAEQQGWVLNLGDVKCCFVLQYDLKIKSYKKGDLFWKDGFSTSQPVDFYLTDLHKVILAYLRQNHGGKVAWMNESLRAAMVEGR